VCVATRRPWMAPYATRWKRRCHSPPSSRRCTRLWGGAGAACTSATSRTL
jgi:hypothetical protein